jgi:hypothetical protein
MSSSEEFEDNKHNLLTNFFINIGHLIANLFKKMYPKRRKKTKTRNAYGVN